MSWCSYLETGAVDHTDSLGVLVLLSRDCDCGSYRQSLCLGVVI